MIIKKQSCSHISPVAKKAKRFITDLLIFAICLCPGRGKNEEKFIKLVQVKRLKMGVCNRRKEKNNGCVQLRKRVVNRTVEDECRERRVMYGY